MRAFTTAGVLAALALAACTSHDDTCGELRTDLKRCGFSANSLSCETVDDGTLQALVGAFAEGGCEAAGRSDGTVDPRLCKAAGWDCPEPPTPAPASTRPAYPLVFVSGIDEAATFDWNPRILAAVDAAHGEGTAYHVKVPGWATTAERSAELWASLASLHERLGTKLNLVCYAVGGLDCRYVASPNGLFDGQPKKHAAVLDVIASVTTIATPHRGTRVADAALAALESGTANDVLAAFSGAPDAKVIPRGGAVQRTLEGLGLDAAPAFNARIVDADGIYYQSFAGISHVLGRASSKTEALVARFCTDASGSPALFRHEGADDVMHEVLWITAPWSSTSRDDEGLVVTSPSDGMISVASAKWGEFRGCVPADHYDVIGQIGKTTRDGVTGFDAPRFYQWIASDLAARGL